MPLSSQTLPGKGEYIKYLRFLKNKFAVFWRKLPTHGMPERCGLLVMAKEKEREIMMEKSYKWKGLQTQSQVNNF